MWVQTTSCLSISHISVLEWIEHFCSVTCITIPNTFVLSAENFIAMASWDKKLWVQKDWKSRQKSCARMPCFRRPGHIPCFMTFSCLDLHYKLQGEFHNSKITSTYAQCFLWEKTSSITLKLVIAVHLSLSKYTCSVRHNMLSLHT